MRSLIVSLARSSHPGPSLAVTAVAAILGASAGLEPWRLVVLTLSVATNQLSIGLSNDWIDAARDSASARRDKPVALGAVGANTVRNAAMVSLVLSIALSLALGPLALAANGVFLLAGWLYNAGLKKTPLSVVPYIVGFGSLPALVTLAQPVPALAAWWAILAGALLGVAAHFANVLPDLDDDRATGVRGLPHILGAKASGIITGMVLGLASVVVVWGPSSQPDLVQLIGGGASVALALTCVILAASRPATQPPTRLMFRIIIVAAILNVALIALTGDRLQ
jgi:4-hydroxybenzoate polyprenyltransferase